MATLEMLQLLVQASEIARARLPAPGTYLLFEESVHGYGCCGSGSFTARHYADVSEPIGNCCPVVFRPHGAPAVRRTIKVAIDGSWRDAYTLTPINYFGTDCTP